ncbi:MAG: hypothetical protein AAGB51_10740 [Planctomycetota bacterium]
MPSTKALASPQLPAHLEQYVFCNMLCIRVKHTNVDAEYTVRIQGGATWPVGRVREFLDLFVGRFLSAPSGVIDPYLPGSDRSWQATWELALKDAAEYAAEASLEFRRRQHDDVRQPRCISSGLFPSAEGTGNLATTICDCIERALPGQTGLELASDFEEDCYDALNSCTSEIAYTIHILRAAARATRQVVWFRTFGDPAVRQRRRL